MFIPTAAYCSVNDPPKNGGVINRARDRPGSRIQYYCNSGYRLVGHRNATCRLHPNGLYQWDNPAPLCQGNWNSSMPFIESVLSFRWLKMALKRRPPFVDDRTKAPPHASTRSRFYPIQHFRRGARNEIARVLLSQCHNGRLFSHGKTEAYLNVFDVSRVLLISLFMLPSARSSVIEELILSSSLRGAPSSISLLLLSHSEPSCLPIRSAVRENALSQRVH